MAFFKPIGATHSNTKRFINLKKNKQPNPGKLITLEGYWEISTVVNSGCSITELYLCHELIKTPEIKKLVSTLETTQKVIYELSSKVFKKMSDREKPDGILAMCALPIHSLHTIDPNTIKKVAILDGLEIPGNIGTIIRSAAASNIDAVVFINRKARLTHPKIMHASMGSCFNLPLIDTNLEQLQDFLQREGFQTFLADAKESATSHTKINEKVAIVIGSEKYGFTPKWYDFKHTLIKIPMSNNIDSLNVACAATVLFYHFFDKNIVSL